MSAAQPINPKGKSVGELNVQQLLQNYRGQIEAALPKHLTPDRMLRFSMTAIRSNPLLAKADAISLMGAIIRASQDGLEPGRDAHLVPFKNGRLSKQRKKDVYDVVYIPDYRGLIKLARNSGIIGTFYANPVFAGDFFEFEYGTEYHLRHRPLNNSTDITHFYAFARSTDGSWEQFQVMTKADVDKVKARSRAKDDGPWVTDYIPMGNKTAVKRLCKFLPQSAELRSALHADDESETGGQDNREVIEGVPFEHVDDEEPPENKGAVATVKEKLKGRQKPDVPRETPESGSAGEPELTPEAAQDAPETAGAPEEPSQQGEQENAPQGETGGADEADPAVSVDLDALLDRLRDEEDPDEMDQIEADARDTFTKGWELSRILDAIADARSGLSKEQDSTA